LNTPSFAYVHFITRTLQPTVDVVKYAGRGVEYVVRDSGKAAKVVGKDVVKAAVVVGKEVI
jgi:hypothetical protein